jgi:hypothetical membrane protein
LALTLSATFLSSWFRWDTNALSELGVGDQAVLFNSAIILGGLLNLPFAAGLYRYLGGERISRAGVLAILAGSVALLLVGVFTVDYLVLHAIVALGYFFLVPIGFLLIGFGSKDSLLRIVSLACGTVALVAILVLPIVVVALQLKVGFAVPELAEALAVLVWTMLLSAVLVKKSGF